MIQAFVSLKPQYPARTESGMRSFFEALQNAVFSQPTIFRSNVDVSVRPYSLDAITEAAMNPRCKFVVLRAECEKFWQCTFLLPDKQGMGALFFDLQRQQSPRRLSPDSLIEMFKKVYKQMGPRVIRIGDSEAREKLKSRHGLVMMPGLGRIEWLQIISPEIYSDIYNPSELVAAPGYQTEIWEDGALFMRVYDDPNDWDSEDNISQANFIPGFLAGVAKVTDSEKEKEILRDLEKLWNRAEKTAEKAYEALSEDPNNVQVAETPKAAPAAKPVVEILEKAEVPLEDGEKQKRSVVYNRLKAEFKVEEDNIVKCGEEGPCTIFKVKAERKPVFYVTYQDMDHKVFILTALEDLARFLSANGCSIKADHYDKLKKLVKTYYHPDYQLIDSLDELPETVIRDRRMPEMRAEFKPSAVETINDTNTLTFWFYKPELQGLETLTFTQFEEWPMQIDSKIRCTDMENEPEKAPEPVKAEAPKAEPVKVEKKEEEVKVSDKKETEASEIVPAKEDEVPAEESEGMSTGAKVGLVIAILVILYVVLVFTMANGDWTLGPVLDMLNGAKDAAPATGAPTNGVTP